MTAMKRWAATSTAVEQARAVPARKPLPLPSRSRRWRPYVGPVVAADGSVRSDGPIGLRHDPTEPIRGSAEGAGRHFRVNARSTRRLMDELITDADADADGAADTGVRADYLDIATLCMMPEDILRVRFR